MKTAVELDGTAMSIAMVNAIATGTSVAATSAGLTRMADSNAIILKAVDEGRPVYGVTTGLGAKATQSLTREEAAEFATKAIRGRAHAIGKPLPRTVVRAAMAIRLNSLLTGASGAAPAIAKHIEACLNADLVPSIGETASVTVADLLWGGTFGLAMIGEGNFLDCTVEKSGNDLLAENGIPELQLGPRDGLALISHNSFSTAHAAIGHHKASRAWRAAQTAAALTLEGFRGSLTPFDPAVIATRQQPGQAEAATDLMTRLTGSELHQPGAARRLQDPLSLRNIAQVHGTTFAALATLEETLLGEINGASDNPVVISGSETIVSGGGYLNPHLGTTLVAANYAIVQLAAQMVARSGKLLFNRFSGLPNGLLSDDANVTGFTPTTKISEALFAEIVQLATPPVIYPSAMADGVEDVVSNFTVSAKALITVADRLSQLTAIEMILAAHAIRLRGIQTSIAPGLRPLFERLDKVSPVLETDRPLSSEIDTVAAWIRAGEIDHLSRQA
ncbi:MAG: aromatic amino acid lyase [Pseudomonadota bacterium]